MGKVYLYCDESGAKGYANRPEAHEAEVGVFAGILVPESHYQTVAANFDAIAAKYAPGEGKNHITDLPVEQKGALRDELFAQIKAAGLPCFWYAIHVQGLHEDFKKEQVRLQTMRQQQQAARAGAQPRVRTGSPREEAKSLHVELFSGLYAHMVAFLAERGQSDVEVEVRTDNVDTPILEQFREVAADLLDTDPQVITLKGYDTVDKKVVEKEYQIKVEHAPELDFNPVVRSLAIDTAPATDGLVLAVDVLSNSLNYLFSHRAPQELYQPLNRPEAIANHPLAAHLDAFGDWGSGDFIGDMLYAHPKQQVR